MQSTALWGNVTSIAVLILAVLSPILGALADYSGMKKKLFLLFLLLGLAGLFSLSVTTEWTAFLCLFVVARVGYSACNVFYDSMLTDVTTDGNRYQTEICRCGESNPLFLGTVWKSLQEFQNIGRQRLCHTDVYKRQQ